MIQDHMSSDGSLLNFNITGAPKGMLFDVYHVLLGLRWWTLLLALFVAYIGIAAVRTGHSNPYGDIAQLCFDGIAHST